MSAPSRSRAAPWALLVFAAALIVPAPALGHYPFPSSEDEKKRAAQIELAVTTPTPAALEGLADLLKDKNARVQTAAIMGLMRLSGRRLVPGRAKGMLGGLKGSKSAWVRGASEAALILLDEDAPLAQRRERLIELTRSKEGPVRRMAVEALREIGGRSILGALEALADDNAGEMVDYFDMKSVARAAFDLWWEIRSERLTEAEKLRVLVGCLRRGEPFGSRWCDAACDLMEKEGEKAVPLLIPLLKGEDRRSKLCAMRTLKAIGGKDAVAALWEVAGSDVESDDRLLRSVAMGVLARFPDKRFVPTYLRVLKSGPDPFMRFQAAQALGQVGDESAVPALKAALSDPAEAVRAQAAADLAAAGRTDGDEILLATVGSGHTLARHTALAAMPHVKAQQKVAERLGELLELQPDVKLPWKERQLRAMRCRDILAELAKWDAKRVRPLAPTLEALLRAKPGYRDAAGLLKKLGYTIRERSGRFEVVAKPE